MNAKSTYKESAYELRRDFILKYLRFPIENGAQEISVNVLDSDFVDDFSTETKTPVKMMMFGANKCLILGATLSRMEREGYLKRNRDSIHGMGGMGFPTWVWSYKLSELAKKGK